jgi:predicted permease
LFLSILNSLAPVFLVITLGWLLRRSDFLSSEALEYLTRLTYWIGIPCLLFVKIATATLVLNQVGDLFLVTLSSTGIGIALSYGLATILGLPKTAIGTFVQAAFRGNLAFVGLPVIIYAFSSSATDAMAAEASTVLIFGPMVVVYNVVAVLVLLFSRHGINVQALPPLLRELASNPLFLSCLTGVSYSALRWPLPIFFERSLTAIGQMALPLALICIGGSLRGIDLRDSWAWSASAAVTKVMLMPLIGYVIAWLAGLSADSTRIALILLACPTATASYVLVQQLGGDQALASGAIVFSTLLAALSLAMVLAVV